MHPFLHWIFKLQILPSDPDINLLLLRLGVAWGFIRVHAWKKLADLKSAAEYLPDPLGIGGEASLWLVLTINTCCAVCVGAGFLTRLNAGIAFIVTFTGLVIVHASDSWVVKDVPWMYSLVFLAIILGGAGRYSTDHCLRQAFQ